MSMCRSLSSATFLRSSSLSRWIGFLPTTPGRGPAGGLPLRRRGHGHGHDHAVSAETDRRRLVIALGLLVGFAAAEVTVGLLAGSVALLADAGHMAADAAALGLALLAIGLAARPPRGALTYGLKRAEPASALANAVTLAVLAVVFTIQAIGRLIEPADVDAGPVLAVAL